jgi:outer membrane lipoprotein carrier protein
MAVALALLLAHPPAIAPADADADAAAAVAGMERRYAQAETASGAFRQVYRAPGMVQEESGVFKLKRPGLMRWEYRTPEEKLFVADGKECFLYVPRDRQVTVHPLTPADIKRTPLSFLLGGGGARRDYRVTAEAEYKASRAGTVLARLTPLRREEEYRFVVLELDAGTHDIRRVVIRERSGNTSEFLLSDVVTGRNASAKDFQFKVPRGVEVVRVND